MSRITGGNGITYIVGNKTTYQLDRFKQWYSKNPDRAVNDMLEGVSLNTFSCKHDLLKHVLRHFKISLTCTEFLRTLHQSIVVKWLNIIDTWKKNHPQNELNLVESSEEHPPNYTPEMSRLKNISFDGFIPGDNLKGYCPFEPIVRLEQLIDYPIHKFEPVELETFEIVQPPEKDYESINITTAKELYDIVLTFETKLQEWESYYDQLCKKINELCKNI